MKAEDFMTKEVFSCKQSQTVEEAAALMSEKGVSVMPVIDDEGLLVGILTESDFVSKEVKIPHAMASMKRLLGVTHYEGDIEAIYASAKKRKLAEVMTKNPKAISPTTSLNSIVTIMEDKKLKRLPVVDNQKLVGMITRKDLLRAFNLAK
ncbi:MAG: CBS domain-containing protein [Halobacteriovoraceae bacterium]|jgi:CBS domain-containing protein|nr:CBS domain-containing protein [Halobacteriovoraceae bacterium]